MYDGKMGQKHEVNKRGHNAAGWYAVSVRHTGRYICSPGERGGGCGRGAGAGCGARLLVNLVPMLEQKKKNSFFFLFVFVLCVCVCFFFFFTLGSAQRCHRLRSENDGILVGKGYSEVAFTEPLTIISVLIVLQDINLISRWFV